MCLLPFFATFKIICGGTFFQKMTFKVGSINKYRIGLTQNDSLNNKYLRFCYVIEEDALTVNEKRSLPGIG